MGNNLAEILGNLKKQSSHNRCSVCKVASQMDEETREAFIDVMRSNVTVKAIVDALNTDGLQLTRYQLGEARRECINGTKACETFKGEQK